MRKKKKKENSEILLLATNTECYLKGMLEFFPKVATQFSVRPCTVNAEQVRKIRAFFRNTRKLQ